MVLDPDLVASLAGWLRDAPAGMAWLTATAGSGLTTTLTTVVRDLDLEAVWLTASNLRSRAFLKDVCCSPLAVNGKRKVVVLDELEAVLGSETAMVDVAHVVKQATRVPLVCAMKSTRAALGCDLRKKAALVVDFPPPTHEAMVAVASAIAQKEGLDQGLVDSLCAQAPGDLRHVLTTLRASVKETRVVGMQTVDSVEKVLGTRVGVRDAMTLFWADPCGLPNGLFETYWKATTEASDCTAYLDMLSAADVLDSCIHGKQRWDLWDAYGALTTCSADVLLPKKRGIQLDKFGTLWNKKYVQCNKAKLLKGVSHTRSGAGGTRLTAEDAACIRMMIASCLPDAERVAAVCRSAGLDAHGCLHIMRLWDSGYKLSTHARVKRALAAGAAG